MINCLSYGKPFETMAVVEKVAPAEALTHFSFEKKTVDGVPSLVFTYELSPEDIVYGLGETMHGINKRGYRYIIFNTDDPHHSDNMPSLYGAHNFIVVDGREHFGVFFDTPARVVFDIDSKGDGLLTVYCETEDLKLYQLEGDTSYAITKEFLGVIGQSYVPPLWAFGYGQSRWGYKSASDISTVAAKYEKAGIPLDFICADIDYMDRFIDFTVHPKRFPDMKGFCRFMGSRGVHLVPIIDAGIKIEPGNPVYEEGVKNDYFCKRSDGKNFGAAVWPGLTHFPDFCKPEARRWFGRQFKTLTDQGIEGFWIDMNEPATFWLEPGTPAAEWTPVPDEERLTPESKRADEYHRFYHDYDGRRMVNYDVHNVFGHFMAMGSGEGLNEVLPDHRYLLFSRSSYVGTHRYAGIWTGDNHSDWLMLKRNLTQMPGLNMVGLLYSGADTGGFGGNVSRELLLRWNALSDFTPLFRNHSYKCAIRQECYRFNGVSDFRDVISLRYRLLPYLYSEFVKAALAQDMYMKPLGFAWPEDETARRCEDQLLVGENIMIAPVLEKGAEGREVYLPVAMTEVRFDGRDFATRKVPAGTYTVNVPLNEVVFWILPDRCVPVANKLCMSTKDMDLADVSLLGDGSSYDQYRDDGYTKDVSEKNIVHLTK